MSLITAALERVTAALAVCEAAFSDLSAVFGKFAAKLDVYCYRRRRRERQAACAHDWRRAGVRHYDQPGVKVCRHCMSFEFDE
jgi:hypothetical protein